MNGLPILRRTGSLLGTLLGALVSTALLAGPAAADPPLTLVLKVERLVHWGEHWPQQALQQLAQLEQPEPPAARRTLALARGELVVRGGPVGEVAAAIADAVAAAQALAPGLAEADGLYLQALLSERLGLSRASDDAQQSLAAYERHCQAKASPPGSSPCEYRRRWRLLNLLALRSGSAHAEQAMREQALEALVLAQKAGDLPRQAGAAGLLARAAAKAASPDDARGYLALAEHLALRTQQPGMLASTRLAEAVVMLYDQQDGGGEVQRAAPARAKLLEALALSQQAQARRLEAQVRGNLAHLALVQKQPALALSEATAALALATALDDQRMQRLLRLNMALAHIGLGRSATAALEIERLLTAWRTDGQRGPMVEALRGQADALAARGDLAGALAAYHRERELDAELDRENREATLAGLRSRHDREAQQRSIELLARDNALKSAALENQALRQRLWLLAGGVATLGLLATLLLVLRVRGSNRALAHSQQRLREQSESDALTGLANRRHMHACLQDASGPGGLHGGLLMLDIDHFKQINDRHGHAAGDAVLVEVARRLAAAARSGDTVARWGGEEFLLLSPGREHGELAPLARRLLATLSEPPVVLPNGTPWRVTASIGHARFPLPPQRLAVDAAQAVNLVDMALYLAKGQGRHRAVGLLAADLADAQALRRLEADFEQGCRDGRVQLQVDIGPGAAAAGRDLDGTPPGPPAVTAPRLAAHSD
ncbi:MAG: GGDEF domain-containing protein [Burkholderiaceae bacterium]|nr:GGDEF domain-containing protein [Burkholderiaceae bacterium]